MHTTSCCLKQIERERRDKEVLVFGIGACAWETEKKERKKGTVSASVWWVVSLKGWFLFKVEKKKKKATTSVVLKNSKPIIQSTHSCLGPRAFWCKLMAFNLVALCQKPHPLKQRSALVPFFHRLWSLLCFFSEINSNNNNIWDEILLHILTTWTLFFSSSF